MFGQKHEITQILNSVYYVTFLSPVFHYYYNFDFFVVCADCLCENDLDDLQNIQNFVESTNEETVQQTVKNISSLSYRLSVLNLFGFQFPSLCVEDKVQGLAKCHAKDKN